MKVRLDGYSENTLRLSQKVDGGRSTHRFSIGTKGLSEAMRLQLEEEQKAHGDLAVIENLEETYSNLALKTLRTMEYAYQNFRFQYILKVDSDSFVRLGAFIKSLKDIQHPRLYWGFLDGRAKPFRKGKWREADWILCDRYLPYQVRLFELDPFLSRGDSEKWRCYCNCDPQIES
ncbi:N-acetyllactosaminide 3-alpha-galactosyltransferase, partial [Cooperia oncophora]